eukprot:1842226-Prymnesium_polylepis.1
MLDVWKPEPGRFRDGAVSYWSVYSIQDARFHCQTCKPVLSCRRSSVQIAAMSSTGSAFFVMVSVSKFMT